MSGESTASNEQENQQIDQESLEELINEDEPTEEEIEKDFSASFDQEDDDDEEDSVKPDADDDEDDEKPSDEQGGEEKPADAQAGADDNNNTSDDDEFKKYRESTEKQIRNLHGHIGGLKSQLEKLTAKPDAPADTKAGDQPSAKQVTEALQSTEKLNELKETYPEVGAAIEEAINAQAAQFQENQDTLKSDVIKEAKATISEEMQMMPITTKYPDWEDTVNTEDFQTWLLDNGPTTEEYSEYSNLCNSSPDEASKLLNSYIRKYPNWWAERGYYVESSDPSEVIKMLDEYNNVAADDAANNDDTAADDDTAAQDDAANQQAANTDQPAKDKRRQKNKNRLSGAVAPTRGNRQPLSKVTTDEEDFQKSFQSG